MSFDVSFCDIRTAKEEAARYRKGMEGALSSLKQSFGRIVNLESFTGEGAAAAKEYIERTHYGYLCDAMTVLIGQLETDLSLYYDRFGAAPLYETVDNARWVSDALQKTENELKRIREEELEPAKSSLETALRIVPEYDYYAGSFQAAESSLENEIVETRKTYEGVEQAEEYGYSLFSDEGGEFERLATAIKKALAFCASGAVSVTNSSPQRYAFFLEGTGLRESYNASVRNQNANQEVVMRTRNNVLAQQLNETRRLQREAEEDKKFWSMVETGGYLIAAVGSAVAVVATGGAAFPMALAAAGGLLSVYKLHEHTEETLEIYEDPSEIRESTSGKKEWSDWAGDAKDAGDLASDSMDAVVANDTMKHLEKAKLEGGKWYGEQKDIKADSLKSLSSGAASTSVEIVADALADHATTDEGRLGYKIGGKVAGKTIDIAVTSSLSAAGGIGVIGSITSAVGEYGVSKADEEILANQVRRKEIEAEREHCFNSKLQLLTEW